MIKKLTIFCFITCFSLVVMAMYCTLIGERFIGIKKACYYDCLGKDVALVLDGFEICPLSIN